MMLLMMMRVALFQASGVEVGEKQTHGAGCPQLQPFVEISSNKKIAKKMRQKEKEQLKAATT